MSNDYKKTHVCHIEGCKAAFSRPYKLDLHLKKHNGEKCFVCDVDGCVKSYTTPSHLKRHQKVVHAKVTKSEEVLCKVCCLSFSNKYNLKKHFNSKHVEGRCFFKCLECSQEFKKKRQLAEHMSCHSGELPYRCTICNSGFSKTHLLNKHNRNHKTYTCDCKQTFTRWTNFCEHRRNSCNLKIMEHECVICNKTFITKSNLKSHSLIHLDESQIDLYQCPYKKCTRSYHYKKNLNEHIKSFHKKSKKKMELNCTEPGCQIVLATYTNLKRHLINVHNCKFKRKTVRKIRCDQGQSTMPLAATLSGIKHKKGLLKIMNSLGNNPKKFPKDSLTNISDNVNQKDCSDNVSSINNANIEKENQGLSQNVKESLKNPDVPILLVGQNILNTNSGDASHYQHCDLEVNPTMELKNKSETELLLDTNIIISGESLNDFDKDLLEKAAEILEELENCTS